MCQPNLVGAGVVILPPEHIEPNKQTYNNKAIGTIPVKQAQKKQKEHTTRHKKEIVKKVLSKLFMDCM